MLTFPGQPSPDGYPDPDYVSLAGEPDDDTWEMPALTSQQAALDALQWNWGQAYDIGIDDGQWWYRRKDRKGGIETAASPDALHTMIVTDYAIMPVLRELSPAVTPQSASGHPAPTGHRP